MYLGFAQATLSGVSIGMEDMLIPPTKNKIIDAADAEDQQGIADFVAGRIDAQGKHGWMLKSFLKEDRA
jgi:DNA-directed RNA polymerase subunit beta'